MNDRLFQDFIQEQFMPATASLSKQFMPATAPPLPTPLFPCFPLSLSFPLGMSVCGLNQHDGTCSVTSSVSV